MENGKWKTENLTGGRRPVAGDPLTCEKSCRACGGAARRGRAKFCSVCGKSLEEDYEPLDSIRASYRLQGKSFDFRTVKSERTEEVADLFELNKNSTAQSAWACLVYATVPYLGILFVPLALVVGAAAYLIAVRRPHLGGRRLALSTVGLSLVVLLVQIFLWWLLYIVPELGRRV